MFFLKKANSGFLLVVLAMTLSVLPLLATGCSGKGSKSQSVSYIVTVGGRDFEVEIADAPASQRLGLSGRNKLAENAGMLFIFDRKQDLAFYMKDCFFDIDAAFIELDESQRIARLVNYETMPVEPDPSNPIKRYRPYRPVRIVLELNGGTLAEMGVKDGDTLQFSESVWVRISSGR